MSQHQAFFEHMRTLQKALKLSCQRRIVVLNGRSENCFAIMDALFTELALEATLFVSKPESSAPGLNETTQLSYVTTLDANKLKQQLGQEVDTLIWDGFSGLNPDALGIASGLLKGGGIFFLLLADYDALVRQGDPDYSRMCADDLTLLQCHTFFLQRLIRHLQADPNVLVYPVDHPESFRLQPAALNLPAASAPQLPTVDQVNALNAISKVAKGHRYRPLVLLADRGRGKSSVLGMAAAQLNLKFGYKIAISAPDKTTCHTAVMHYQDTIAARCSDPDTLQAGLQAFQFLPLDQLPEKSNEFHLILIDEAAAVPIPLLQQLINTHPRLVFATTLHGYEGHGQGFAVRFRQTLDQFTPQWQALTLNTPVRWLEHDVVEQWFFRFLLLDASTAERLSFNTDATATESAGSAGNELKILWLEQVDLHQNEALFESIFSLLVSAHYQTKPSDIRLILDHPHVKLAIALSSVSADYPAADDDQQLLGVMLILEEGGLETSLAADIISGTRRPRGHLFPQALCASSGNPACLTQRTYRITRIAVDLHARQQGIGSALLEAACQLARDNHFDSLSSSFGLRPELLNFWSKNHFDIVKLGLHADGASGTQSIMLMRPVSGAASSLSKQLGNQFQSYFLFNLSRLYQSLDCGHCLAILKKLASRTQAVDFAPGVVTPTLQAFAFGHRSFEDSNQEIFSYMLASLTHPAWSNLDQFTADLLVMKVFQGHSNEHCSKYLPWQGKKAIEKGLREALKILILS